jgi:hypothetical protein
LENNLKIDILGIFADDKSLINYRPALNKITGSVLSTILLSQVLYWWKKKGGKEFYKFRDKCNHALYNEGDSWCEELGFSVKEFDNAIKRIGFKLGKTENHIKKEEAFIIYYRDSQGVTWYNVNADYLEKRINGIYLVNALSATTKEMPFRQLPLNTETNPEKIVSDSTYEIKEDPEINKELSVFFSNPEIDVLAETYRPDQLRSGLTSLSKGKDIKNKKAYLKKILKNNYPSRETPVINDNGNNPGENPYIDWKVIKDPLSPEARIKVNERIAIKAGELAKKLKKGIFV